MPFNGFGPGAAAFFGDLRRNNSRTWFDANRARYEREIREPAESFVLDLGKLLAGDFPSVIYDTRRNGSGSVMRIYRDIRFSPDKRPFKENLGVIFPLAPGKKVQVPIFYFHLDAKESFFYGGQHVMTPETLARYRAAVGDEKTGPALERILAELAERGIGEMEEPTYKRPPRGYRADHPRLRLLRQAALGVGIPLAPEELASPGLPARCADAAATMGSLMEWLGRMNERAL